MVGYFNWIEYSQLSPFVIPIHVICQTHINVKYGLPPICTEKKKLLASYVVLSGASCYNKPVIK